MWIEYMYNVRTYKYTNTYTYTYIYSHIQYTLDPPYAHTRAHILATKFASHELIAIHAKIVAKKNIINQKDFTTYHKISCEIEEINQINKQWNTKSKHVRHSDTTVTPVRAFLKTFGHI